MANTPSGHGRITASGSSGSAPRSLRSSSRRTQRHRSPGLLPLPQSSTGQVPREASAGELLLKQTEIFVSANERREDKERAAAERREDKERAAAERREERLFQLLCGQMRSPPSSDNDEPRSKRKR